MKKLYFKLKNTIKFSISIKYKREITKTYKIDTNNL